MLTSKIDQMIKILICQLFNHLSVNLRDTSKELMVCKRFWELDQVKSVRTNREIEIYKLSHNRASFHIVILLEPSLENSWTDLNKSLHLTLKHAALSAQVQSTTATYLTPTPDTRTCMLSIPNLFSHQHQEIKETDPL